MISLRRSSAIMGKAAAFFLAAVLVLVMGADWFSPADPYRQELSSMVLPPLSVSENGAFHLLGTDQLGRDVLARLLFGGRLSLLMSLAAVLVSALVGTALGLVAGYFRGAADAVIMRLADVQLSIPMMLLAILVIALSGAGLMNTILVLALAGWVPFARVVRSEVLAIREREFVECARAMGVGAFTIIATHVLPNLFYTLVTQATLQMARMILLAASLSFLGLGVDVSLPTWGGMISDGRNYIEDAWWLTVIPGLAIALVIFAINLLSDWLQAVADRR